MRRRTADHWRMMYQIFFLMGWRSHIGVGIQMENWRRTTSSSYGWRGSIGVIFANGPLDVFCMPHSSKKTVGPTSSRRNPICFFSCILWPWNLHLWSSPKCPIRRKLQIPSLIPLRVRTYNFIMGGWSWIWYVVLKGMAHIICWIELSQGLMKYVILWSLFRQF